MADAYKKLIMAVKPLDLGVLTNKQQAGFFLLIHTPLLKPIYLLAS
jgi:hypothetical protein